MKNSGTFKWYEQNFVVLLGGITIIGLIIAGQMLLSYLESKNREIISFQLDANLNTTVDRLNDWLIRSKGKIDIIVNDTGDNVLFSRLISRQGDINELRSEIDEKIIPILSPLGFDGYSIFDNERKLLAATSKEYIGVTASTPTIISVLNKADKGQYGISQPVIANKNIEGPAGIQPVGTLFQMICTRINDLRNNGMKIGYFCLRFNPAEDFFPLFKTGLVGKTGESYAISPAGKLLTPSRFMNNIEIHPDGYAYITKEIIVSVSGNTEGQYTKLAKQVLAQQYGVAIFDYKDYRDVDVVGKGRWLENFEIGVLVEQDSDEAFQAFNIAKQVIFGLEAIAITLIVFLSLVFSYNRHVLYLREKRFRDLLRNIPLPMYIKDQQGIFQAVNPAFEKLTGMLGSDIGNPPEKKPESKVEFSRSLYAGGSA